MPLFTPPTEDQASDDFFFGRFSVQVGLSVVKVNGTFTTMPYPWLGDLADLTEGTDWFQGGRSYVISPDVAGELSAAGYEVS